MNQQNREARRAHFFAFENEDKAKGDKKQSDRYLSMEGKWKFNFVKNHQDAPKGFYALKYDDSKWVDFPVPASPYSRTLLARRPLTKASVLAISFSFWSS